MPYLGGWQHAGLDDISANVLQHGVYLASEVVKWHCVEAVHTLCVLLCHGRDGRSAKDTERLEGLEICLYAGAAARV